MQVVSTAALPIDLAGQVAAAVPGAVVRAPAAGHTPIAEVELAGADALICLLRDRVDGAVLARAPRLRVIANCAVGYDNLDLAATRAAGVWVTHTPDVLTEATAELAFALALAAARRLGEGERLVRSGAWAGWALDQLLGVGLAGKTFGVVGYGRIGQAVGRRAAAFGMDVVYAGPRPVDGAPGRWVELDALFAAADVVSLHCPLTPATHHLVDARRLAQMKPTAILVNTARGGCVDHAALAAALDRGALFAAGLDVYPAEPDIPAPVRAHPRVVLLPHLGSATTEARAAMAQRCADAVIAVLRGERPPHVVPGSAPANPAPGFGRRAAALE